MIPLSVVSSYKSYSSLARQHRISRLIGVKGEEWESGSMRLEPTPKSDHVLQVSARLVTASRILHLSAEELEHAISQEQAENPALEVNESAICLFCGTSL